ncbi:MAG: hypothetical protein AB8B69_10875 [Chitinophagales bacterium]
MSKKTEKFLPSRITQTATIYLHSTPDAVFPLFGPIAEKKWADAWNPEVVYSETGELERNMVFKTYGFKNGKTAYLWVISYLNFEEKQVVYTVSSKNRTWTIDVQCRSMEGDLTKTAVEVTYTYIGLTSKGNKRNKKALKAKYQYELKDWEESINYFLETGRKLKSSH